MGGLKKYMPITYWTFLIGAAGDRRRARPGRLLQQGRDPLPGLLHRPHRPVGHRRADGAADRLLHVPPDLHDLPRRGTVRRGAPATAMHGARPRRPGHDAHGARPTTATGTVTAITARRTSRPGRWRCRWSCSPSDRWRPATSACRMRSAAATPSRRSCTRASTRPRCTARQWLAASTRAGDTAHRRAGTCRRTRGRSCGGGHDAAAGHDDPSKTQTELTLMGVSTVLAFARHRPGGVLLPAAARGGRCGGDQPGAGVPAAVEQVLRGRDLRRRDRASAA